MRVISGELKGRKLIAPKGEDVRPTSDKVKEAMFSILMPYLKGAKCLDLFAGTGALGIEAISRGADFCVFCDKNRESISVIKNNITTCGIEERAKVVLGDYMKVLERISHKSDIVLIDPPYASGLYEKALESIEKLDLLEDEGIILVEHERDVDLPDSIGELAKEKERKYGRIMLTVYGYVDKETK